MIDLVIVLAFVVYAISAGFRARRKASGSLGEYFLAGKTITGWRAGFSMAATQFAADTPLLVMGLVATGGIFLLWRLWVYGLAFLLMAFVFAVAWRRSGVLTDAELTEIRYSGPGVLPLRVLKAVYYGTVINCVVMAMVLVAAVRIAEVFLPWHEWLPAGLHQGLVSATATLGITLQSATGLPPEIATANNLLSILLILAFTALYSTTGGLRSVITTDVAQLFLALGGTAIYAWVVVRAAGGLGEIPHRLNALYGEEMTSHLLSFSAPAGELLMPFLIIISLQWLFQMNSDGTGYLAQRSMACRTDRDARMAGVIFSWTQIVVRSLIWLLIAVGLLVLYPFSPADAAADGFVASREILFVSGIDDLLPVGIRGLMLTGLLAALASTLDTHLNWGASYWSNDIYRRLYCNRIQGREASNRELVVVARLSNILILTIALVIMANLDSIQEAWILSLLFGAGMGSVLVLRWVWERINLWSELAAIGTSIVAATIILFTVEAEWLQLALMAITTTVAAIGITFLTPQTREDVLVDFYRRVHPMGWWGRTAVAAGMDRNAPLRELGTRLRATARCGASLFLVLVGAGKLLVRPPDEQIWLGLALLVAGLVLVPFWWKDAFLAETLSEERPIIEPTSEPVK
jgi:solute:Na+ symporter, SSS family